MVNTLSVPESKISGVILARPITETPNVFFSWDKRPATSGVTGSIIEEVFIFKAREIAIFLGINGVVDEWENACCEATSIEVQS